jgi:hypothetical protein
MPAEVRRATEFTLAMCLGVLAGRTADLVLWLLAGSSALLLVGDLALPRLRGVFAGRRLGTNAMVRLRVELWMNTTRLRDMLSTGQFQPNNLPRARWDDYKYVIERLRDTELRSALQEAYSDGIIRINHTKDRRQMEGTLEIREGDRVAEALQLVENAVGLLDARLGR